MRYGCSCSVCLEANHSQTETKSSFWVIAAAIKQFYERHQELPLPGSVPDMKAQSTVYVQLQNLYKTKARQDSAEVFNTVAATRSDIPLKEVETFCKNAAFIKLIRGSNPNAANLSEILSKHQSSFCLSVY
jgi:amyloid beta precursor protein binding protein 1